MIFGWETEKEKLLRFMKIPPKKKLEWLNQMRQFMLLQPKKLNKIRRQLRENNSIGRHDETNRA